MEVLEVKMAEKTVYMDSVDFEDLSPLQKKKVLSKKTVVKKGELLTMDDSEASLLGFSRMSVANIDEFIRKIGIEGYQIIKIEQKWSETLSRFINSIASVLLLVGLAALYIELKAPGFGAPGIIGIVCLALVFLNQYIVGLADYTELIAIAIGLVLLGFELFVIPGFGIAGIAGFIFIAVGMILAFQDFVIPKPEFPWEADLLVGNVTQVLGSFLAAWTEISESFSRICYVHAFFALCFPKIFECDKRAIPVGIIDRCPCRFNGSKGGHCGRYRGCHDVFEAFG